MNSNIHQCFKCLLSNWTAAVSPAVPDAGSTALVNTSVNLHHIFFLLPFFPVTAVTACWKTAKGTYVVNQPQPVCNRSSSIFHTSELQKGQKYPFYLFFLLDLKMQALTPWNSILSPSHTVIYTARVTCLCRGQLLMAWQSCCCSISGSLFLTPCCRVTEVTVEGGQLKSVEEDVKEEGEKCCVLTRCFIQHMHPPF